MNSHNAQPAILPLVIEDLRFCVGDTCLIDGIELRLDPGPATVVLGPNGAGKSLLMRLCHGLLKPTGGSVTWSGPEAGHADRHQAMVFQRPVLLRRSARANIDYALKLKGVPPQERRKRSEEALAVAGLSGVAERTARVLSGGEQQRLALARAWALRPEVLFLDEPTANLDPSATKAIEAIIKSIEAAGTRILMTTHDLGQAKRIGSDVLFIHRGRIVERGACQAFFKSPQSAAAQAFLAGELFV